MATDLTGSASAGSANSENPNPSLSCGSAGCLSELKFLVPIYIIAAITASFFIAACGPGCCFVFYSIIAGVSGFLMLRESRFSRWICLGVLLLSLLGMWHEKEVRDTWGQNKLRIQIQRLEQQLQESQHK